MFVGRSKLFFQFKGNNPPAEVCEGPGVASIHGHGTGGALGGPYAGPVQATEGGVMGMFLWGAGLPRPLHNCLQRLERSA